MSSLDKKVTVIIEFKCRKQKRRILIDKKNLHNKSDGLMQVKFPGKLFVFGGICHENHQLSYKCRQKSISHSFAVMIKLEERSQLIKIHHIIDTEKFRVNDLNEFIKNIPF